MLKEKRDQRAALKTEKTNKETALTNTNNRIAKLNQRIETINNKIPRLRNRIRNLRQTIPGQEANIANIETDLSGQRANLDDLIIRRDRVITRLNNTEQNMRYKNDEINGLVADYEDLARRKSNLEDHNYRLSNAINELEETISSNEGTISYYQSEIIRLNQLIDDLTDENVTLREQIASLEEAQRIAWNNFRNADADASAAEEVTAQKLADYRKIRANYDRELAKAKASGKDQGLSVGNEMAIEPGDQDGTAAGNQEGKFIGRQEGLLFGYKKGLEDGTAEGKDAGYTHGINAPENYDAGYKVGWKQGKKNAYTYAHQTQYPRGRKEKKAELLSYTPNRQVTVDNRDQSGYSAGPGDFNPSNPLYGGEYDAPADHQNDANDAAMSKIWNKIGSLEQQIDNLPTESSFEVGNITVSFSVDKTQANCEADYIDFINACYASYDSAYKGAYRRSYLSTYKESKEAAFQSLKQSTFNEFKDARWQEGRDEAYPISYEKWDDIGANEAQNTGYQDGKNNGYNENIATAEEREYELGVQDELKYFRNNAVLRLHGAEIIKARKTTEDGKFIAGDDLVINIKVANYGHQDSAKGQATVRLMALTNNVTVDGSQHDIVSIPSQTMAFVKFAAYAKIKLDAVLPQDVTIRVITTMPDGVTNTEDVTIRTKMHMVTRMDNPMESSYGYDDDITLFVKVTNITPVDAMHDFVITMDVPEYYKRKKAFRLRKTSDNLGRIRAGRSETARLNFDIYKKRYIENKTIPFTFTVWFKGVISSQETINVKFEKKCEPGEMTWGCI